MENTKKILNQAVADLSQAAAVIHQIHWYIRGTSFFTIHAKMDEYLDQINEQQDEVAERLITIGGAPFSTLSEFAANTKIADKTGDFSVSTADHLDSLLDCFKYLSKLYKEGIATAETDGDAVTADLFTSLKAAIDKDVWMVSAYLSKTPEID